MPAPGRLVAGHGDPELAVEEAEEEHRQHGEGEQVTLPAPARHEPVRAANRPWSHQRVLLSVRRRQAGQATNKQCRQSFAATNMQQVSLHT